MSTVDIFHDSGLPAELRDAFGAAFRRFSGSPHVTGIDIGPKWVGGVESDAEEELFVRVHVRSKRPAGELDPDELIPAEVAGITTDVVEAVWVRDGGGWYDFDPDRAALRETLQPGISLANRSGTYGTLGLFVTDTKTEAICILSADHVLAPLEGDGRDVVQPGPWDLPYEERNVVGRLWRRQPYHGVSIARLDAPRPFARELFDTDILVSGTRMPRIGDVLEKSGRTTGVTRARVDGFGSYAACFPAILLVPEDDGGDIEISAEGDSGAVWYDPDTREAVAVQCIGEDPQAPNLEWAAAAVLEPIARKLGVEVR